MFALLKKEESYMSLIYGEISIIMSEYAKIKINQLEERIEKYERKNTRIHTRKGKGRR